MSTQGNYFFTSESVGIGHPDKMADQISDAVLDECLMSDPFAKVACETLVSTGLVLLAGEISTEANIDFQSVVRETIDEIGYNESIFGFDSRACSVLVGINEQSPDIAKAVIEGGAGFHQPGAGDQGMMFGFACDETPELMPLPLMLSHHIVRELNRLRVSGELKYLRPDAKAQITCEYSADHVPFRIEAVVVSSQHDAEVDQKVIGADIRALVQRLAPEGMLDKETRFFINPSGRFVIGGPVADCGVTGRKIMVDSYGGFCPHGGGAFSGKDPTKVDRSAAYGARYVAKNIVAAKLAKKCEVQISYAIGVPYPISIYVNTFGTGVVSDGKLCHAIPEIFDLSPEGLIEMLNLRRPIYRPTAFGGHFGREERGFTWEKCDRVERLLEVVHVSSVKR